MTHPLQLWHCLWFWAEQWVSTWCSCKMLWTNVSQLSWWRLSCHHGIHHWVFIILRNLYDSGDYEGHPNCEVLCLGSCHGGGEKGCRHWKSHSLASKVHSWWMRTFSPKKLDIMISSSKLKRMFSMPLWMQEQIKKLRTRELTFLNLYFKLCPLTAELKTCRVFAETVHHGATLPWWVVQVFQLVFFTDSLMDANRQQLCGTFQRLS